LGSPPGVIEVLMGAEIEPEGCSLSWNDPPPLTEVAGYILSIPTIPLTL
jgi:hypothetical protein